MVDFSYGTLTPVLISVGPSAEVVSLKAEVTRLNQDLDRLMRQLDEATYRNVALKQDLYCAHKELASAKGSMASQNAVASFTQLERERDAALRKIEELKCDLRASKAQREGLSSVCAQHRNTIEVRTMQLDAASSQRDKLERELLELKAALIELMTKYQVAK